MLAGQIAEIFRNTNIPGYYTFACTVYSIPGFNDLITRLNSDFCTRSPGPLPGVKVGGDFTLPPQKSMFFERRLTNFSSICDNCRWQIKNITFLK